MLRFVDTALVDADILLYVTDVVESFEKNAGYLEKISKAKVPVMILINKIDLSNQEKLTTLVERWREVVPDAEIIPISAKEKFNLDYVFKRILANLPEGPAYFSKDELTDRNERFFVQEIIREKVLLLYQKEIPYSVEIEVESFKDEPNLLKIAAVIYVERDSQKAIIIGHQGKALKQVGMEARLDIEEFFGKKTFLELFVKVARDWRDRESQLRSFGYDLQ
jgi:GTP-binding protein Era